MEGIENWERFKTVGRVEERIRKRRGGSREIKGKGDELEKHITKKNGKELEMREGNRQVKNGRGETKG